MTTPRTEGLSTRAFEQWAQTTTVTLKRFQFERAVRNLSLLESIALIRAAYDCSLEDAKCIREAIGKAGY